MPLCVFKGDSSIALQDNCKIGFTERAEGLPISDKEIASRPRFARNYKLALIPRQPDNRWFRVAFSFGRFQAPIVLEK